MRQPIAGKRVVVAMSGGVDSSVAAALLAKTDCDLSAVFMRNWDKRDEIGGDSGCQWERDWADVQSVCRLLDIPVRMVDLSQQYWTRVFEPSLEDWERGVTPNPDVPCNREVKFGALMDQVISTPSEWLATGHYARSVSNGDERVSLLKAVDPVKDQSYFLSSVTQRQISQALFPLGGLHKTQVRELAKKFGLPTASRPESMGLCFVGQKEGRIDRWLAQYLAPNPGPIIDLQGNILGEHKGLWTFTVGQGARISGKSMRHFIAKKNPETNTIVVVPGSDHPALFSTSASTSAWHWIAGEAPAGYEKGTSFHGTVKICHGEREEKCTATAHDAGIKITFALPIRGVAPGQYAVVYDDDVCLGSGKIDSTDTLQEHSTP